MKKFMLIVTLALVVGLAGSANAAIVREYLFDSQSGTPATPEYAQTTPDTSGNGFHAQMKGPEGVVADAGGTVANNGRIKKAENVLAVVPFGGVQSTYLLDLTSNTVAMWFKTDGEWIDGVDNWTGLFYGNGNGSLQVGGNDNAGPMADGFVQSWSWNGGVATSLLVTPQTYDDGTWHHLVRTQGGGTKIYMDGLLVVSMAANGGTGGNDRIAFGESTGTGWASYFSGHIDNARIYDVPLSESEVWDLYVSETTPEPATMMLLGLGSLAALRKRRRA